MTKTDSTVTSADGTTIAYERWGAGPAVVLVEPAGHFRAFSVCQGLGELLAADFTVYAYDRRGRGASGDTPPYQVQREVDDLAALVTEAGGSAALYGHSSGAALALQAAAAGLPVSRMALQEPPINDEPSPEGSEFTRRLAELAAAGEPADVVEYFMTSIGVPEELLDGMRTGAEWQAMESVAATFTYDGVIADATWLGLLESVPTRTLVVSSDASTEDLTSWASAAAYRLPNGTHRSLPGEWHGVADDVLAPVVREFFATTD